MAIRPFLTRPALRSLAAWRRAHAQPRNERSFRAASAASSYASLA
jgi:hypothetical protein